MLKKYVITALLVSVCTSLFAQQYKAGEMIEGIRCKDDRDFSYILYLPTSYDAARTDKYPVMFVMSPSGGKARSLTRYIEGAEKNNWILAMSTESKNNYNKSHDAIEAMVEDVFDLFHVNEKRCYSSGMSGGGREAFWLANEMKSEIIGIIPCGAGDSGNTYKNRALAYGLCGGSCFNRWDMTITFNERIKDDGRLRFFPGGHTWAGEDLITDAMTWLNAKYLAKKGSKVEVDQFSEMLFSSIKDNYETDPVFAYENALVLSELKKGPQNAQIKKVLAKLQMDPTIKTYIQAQDDMEDFADEHFNTDVMDCYNNSCTSRQKKDAEKLLAKYKDTPQADVITHFGKPSKKL